MYEQQGMYKFSVTKMPHASSAWNIHLSKLLLKSHCLSTCVRSNKQLIYFVRETYCDGVLFFSWTHFFHFLTEKKRSVYKLGSIIVNIQLKWKGSNLSSTSLIRRQSMFVIGLCWFHDQKGWMCSTILQNIETWALQL